MVSKHHSPLVWPRRDDDSTAIAKIQLDVLARLLDPLLPRSNDCVPVDPYDGYNDDDDAEDDAELGRRVEAVPGVFRARCAIVAWRLALGEYVDLLDVGLERRHGSNLFSICVTVRYVWVAGWLAGGRCTEATTSRPRLRRR